MIDRDESLSPRRVNTRPGSERSGSYDSHESIDTTLELGFEDAEEVGIDITLLAQAYWAGWREIFIPVWVEEEVAGIEIIDGSGQISVYVSPHSGQGESLRYLGLRSIVDHLTQEQFETTPHAAEPARMDRHSSQLSCSGGSKCCGMCEDASRTLSLAR